MEKPERVRRAQFSGDKEALSKMGRAGAKQKMINEDGETLKAERTEEQRAQEEAFRLKQSGEDLVPPQD